MIKITIIAIMGIALLMIFAIIPTQTASAVLISTSPETVHTATQNGDYVGRTITLSTSFHCVIPGPFGGCSDGHTDFTQKNVWSAQTTSSSGTTGSAYTLNVKSLKDFDMDLTGDQDDGTSLTIEYSDTTVAAIASGLNTYTPSAKGIAQITGTSSVASSALSAFNAGVPPDSGTFTCHSGPFVSCSTGVFAVISASETATDDYVLEITQANAGGPKPRLVQDSGVNLLGFSTITQFFDLPGGSSSLTVSAPGATTCEVFDQRGASRGACSAGAIALGNGDYSGLWSVVAENADTSATTTLSAIVDAIPAKLLTEIP